MTPLSMLQTRLYLLLLAAVPFVASRTCEAAQRPNIIIMLADDMGLGDTSAYQDFTGNSDQHQLHTPNMERLARMGVRFTDAHAPSSRCSPTRYALLTGRYAWRNRLKHWVLFGAQGDPMIEADRPTIATLLRDAGYRTGMVGKWHVGLRYRRSDGSPAAGWDDADLSQPLQDTPLDHGFDECWITSRSHGTSGPRPLTDQNRPDQTVGPGHIHGRTAIGATKHGKQLVTEGPNAYVLFKLGSRHFNRADTFLKHHFTGEETREKPVFLYYACNSNHTPYTPDRQIGGQPVAGAARNMAGETMHKRSDFIYENDVALGRLLDYLEQTDDPRNPGSKLIANTMIIFTSDNGAERDKQTATGPFRSNKSSTYEGGHRVPFLVAYPAGGIGDGDPDSPGITSNALIGLQDLYATFANLLGVELPELRAGEKGGEDSMNVLAAFKGESLPSRPMFFNDHKQAEDHAVAALRLDDPSIEGRHFRGQWKLFFDAALLRAGEARPIELYDIASDPKETTNRLDEPEIQPLVKHLTEQALLHRTAGGHRLAVLASDDRLSFDWRAVPETGNQSGRVSLSDMFSQQPAKPLTVSASMPSGQPIEMTVTPVRGDAPLQQADFVVSAHGLGISAGDSVQIDRGEALLIQFNHDVIVESATIVAGPGAAGGFYRLGRHAPLAIYCIDADIDAQDQSGILSDLALLKAGDTLRLDSSPHFSVEAAGQWWLGTLTVRIPKEGLPHQP